MSLLTPFFFLLLAGSGILNSGPQLTSGEKPQVRMYGFEFDYPDEDIVSVDFMGMDIIENMANTNVTQSVEHRHEFSQTFTFEQSASFQSVLSFGYEFSSPDLSIFGVGISFDVHALINFGEGSTYAHTMSFSEIKEVQSSRTIQVPPYESVQACSTVASNSDFYLDYDAFLRFPRILPRSLDDLVNQLVQAGYPRDTMVKEGDSVRVPVVGKLSGSMALHTAFYVSSNGSGDDSCGALKRKFEERDHYRATSKYRGEVKDRIDREIQTIIHNLRTTSKL